MECGFLSYGQVSAIDIEVHGVRKISDLHEFYIISR